MPSSTPQQGPNNLGCAGSQICARQLLLEQMYISLTQNIGQLTTAGKSFMNIWRKQTNKFRPKCPARDCNKIYPNQGKTKKMFATSVEKNGQSIRPTLVGPYIYMRFFSRLYELIFGLH